MGKFWVEAEGKSEEEAIAAGLEELGISRGEAEVEVVKPSKGILGIKRPIRVKVSLKEGALLRACEILEEILSLMTVEAVLRFRQEGDSFWINLEGEVLGILIGHHGQTLEALQLLVNIIAGRDQPAPRRVVLDINGYRVHRKKSLEALAQRAVGKVLARREAVRLRPMSAFERRIVHTVVSQYSGVQSLSSGDEPERYVTISPIEG